MTKNPLVPETPASKSGLRTKTSLEGEPILGVVVPAFNEAATIAEILQRVEALSIVREIVVVDDCSTDGTAQIVEALHSPRIRLIRQPTNMGKTAAVRRGIQEISSPLVIIQDADLEYDPDEIPYVIAPLLQGRADVVYGSRFLVRKAARVLYFYHFVANKFLTLLSNLLTNRNMTDIETCYKAFRTPLLQQMPITSSGFGMEVEITAMISKTAARTYEVPISYYGRTYEEGKKISWIDGVHAIWYIIYYNLVASRSASRRNYVQQMNCWLAESKTKITSDQGRTSEESQVFERQQRTDTPSGDQVERPAAEARRAVGAVPVRANDDVPQRA